MRHRPTSIVTAALLSATVAAASPDSGPAALDLQSYSNPGEVAVRHLALDLEVRFADKTLAGTAELTLERRRPEAAALVLDTKDLAIEQVETSADGAAFQPATWLVGPSDPVRGAPLAVALPADATHVRIAYTTSPGASALQWLEPAQTAGKRHPYLFTQGQALHTRSWIPLQDTPQVRITYSARIKTPPELFAVMSAANDPLSPRDGDYDFRMEQPIPSYLVALAVGDIAFASTGERSGVYAEPAVVEAAAWEFADTEKMIAATEALYGPYRWGRYDLLVLPPSFPYGGMENPRLTFASPTVIAGDRSLVALVAHELAHSWSGNLVTNATWNDFWLNEGFTTYIERRILEALYGREHAELEWALGGQAVEEEMAPMPAWQQALAGPQGAADPDAIFSGVPYQKGALLLRALEQAYGRDRFDAWLAGYFERHAFQSLTTAGFLADLEANLVASDPEPAQRVGIESWLYGPGLPASAPEPSAAGLTRVDALAADWAASRTTAAELPIADWSTQERLRFLRAAPLPQGAARLAELDGAFGLSASGNSELAFQWLKMAIASDYAPAWPRLEEFLTSQGRRKFLKPLFEELVKTPAGRERAAAIYSKARPGYHPIAQAAVDAILSPAP